MIKRGIVLAIALVCGPIYAKSSCNDIHGQPSYSPLSIKSGTICFVQEPVLDPKTKASAGADAIALYYIPNGSTPIKADGRGLPYDDTPGKIIDAFSTNIGHEREEKIFVIHSMDVRQSLVEPNSSGKFYSVSVFSPTNGTLSRDERASNWFGADYSWLSDGHKVIYKFPYQTKVDIQQAIDSPFASIMRVDTRIPVTVKDKSYLFDGPNIKNKTKKYLIKGDRATVEDVTAGWCQVNYVAGKKPLDMWLMCRSLNADSQAKN